MGPSGSGKTTLLDCLASHVQQSNNLLLEGEIFVNGEICNQNMGNIRKGYVRQEDIFYSQMTVRETLRFVARLKLPREVTYEEKMTVVEKLIKRLSLSKCADTLVGEATVGRQRGISGGERKRLSIACELIGDPRLLFLDEPTTGLDSFQVWIRPLLDCMGSEFLICARLSDRRRKKSWSVSRIWPMMAAPFFAWYTSPAARSFRCLRTWCCCPRDA